MHGRRWIEPEPVQVSDELIKLAGGQRLIAEILARRGWTDIASTRAFLDAAYYVPASPYDLPGMDRAVERVRKALQAHEKILIWGDFDVDGQTATTLLVTALRKCEANVDYYIPDRLTEGHGIAIGRLEQLLQPGDIKLIITCDTGISAHEAIDFAQGRGVDVIVTDHHQLPAELPNALVCINPQMLPQTHPLNTLPGVGCAFKFIEALYGAIRPHESLDEFLDLVALGIVADVAVQTGDTRYLLQKGLQVLRQGQRLGLQWMMKIAEISPEKLDEEQIGFVLAPRLNALGRLGDANDGVELLATDNEERARVLAYRLEGLNNERRLLTGQMFDSAVKQIEENPALLNHDVLVLTHPEWAPGVLGIVANRLVEVYNRPVVMLTNPQGELASGSARSVAGIDITSAIAECSSLLERYGGHTMAAGVALKPDKIGDFRRMLSRAVRTQTKVAVGAGDLKIDAYIDIMDVTLQLVEGLRRIAPFGAGNPPITFGIKQLKMKNARSLGKANEHYRLSFEDQGGISGQVVWWQADESAIPAVDELFDLACTIRENEYKGKSEILIQYVDSVKLEDPATPQKRHEFEVIDYRRSEAPEALLKDMIREQSDICIWNEGQPLAGIVTRRRHELQQNDALVIWSVPPDAESWKEALRIVNPEKVYVFAAKTDAATVDNLLKYVAGLVKYALKEYEGRINLWQFASLTGQTVAIVSRCIEWLVSQNSIRIVNKETNELGKFWFIEQAQGSSEVALSGDELRDSIKRMVEETEAYRAYFQNASLEGLIPQKKRGN